MKLKYLVIVLIVFTVGKANAQYYPKYYTYQMNFDGYYSVLTWGPWQHEMWERYYTDKLFYIPSDGSATKSFRFMDQTTYGETGVDYDKNSCTKGSRDWHFRIFYTFNDPTIYWSNSYTPASVGTTPVQMHIYYWNEGHCDDHGYPGNDQWIYSTFNINVEQPQWNTSVKTFQNICKNDNTNYNLADYFSVSGATFNLDYSGDTTWQYSDFPDYSHDYQVDNDMYTVSYPWVDDGFGGGYYDYSNPDTTWQYPDFPNYSQDYQRSNNMYTAYPHLITQLNASTLSPGVHTLLAIKTYDNGVYDSYYGSHRGQVLFPVTISVLPAAPVAQDVSVTASCKGASNGTITLSGVTGGDGNYRYILKDAGNTNPCIPGQSCFDGSAWGDFSGSSYTITGVKPGSYSLWLINNGAQTGACYSTRPVTIPELSQMDTLPIAIQHITCPGGTNGSVNVTDTGGRAPYTFWLTSPDVALTNTTGGFTSLKSGTYTMLTKDGCGQPVQTTIVLTEPLPVTITATASATDCNYPANGAIDINASGGSGTFDYSLYDSTGALVSQQLGSTATTWSLSAVGANKYTASVTNTAAPGCVATTQQVVVIGPPDLYINYMGQTNNKCSYDAMGTLQMSGGGGQSNGYIFFLQNTATGDILQSTTGNFSNLPAADYKAWVRNRDLSCNDSALYALPISITAPPALQAPATATDISCNGKGDGTLQATVSGGVPGYSLQWQQWDEQASNWLAMSGMNALSESGLLKGTYRLLVNDQNNCTTYSNTVVIGEPASLLITSVDRKDIVCYGTTGSIQMNVSGGNGSYTYMLSSDNGNSWTAFTASTGLTAGSYQLKVNDSKGCITYYNQNTDITSPAQPLAITYTLTDYNGYNVPCYGSNNGVVKLNATGGNGSTYTGYAFATDNGSYNTASIITTNAGNHTFSVKDARGCIVSATATLTQPQSQMQTIVSNKLNNDCAGGKAGEVTVSTSGGTPQYTFSINGTDYQLSPVFSQLASGNYQVNIHDVNGCADSIKVPVIDLNPPITDVATISNVLCYNGSDGSIKLSTSGGVPSYTYAWKNSTNTGNVLSGLQVGNYSVTITDSKGCAVSDNFTVGQPQHPLSATVFARPVCINNPYGNIVFDAQGGTAPYTCSINGGSSYSTNATFTNIAAGSYPVTVSDANGCTWNGTATVPVNNMDPVLNFLISTRQNALDTLQVKEVCVPKPDSIQWTFDPQTQVIDNNMFSPVIRYNKEGNYPVAMRAWFNGCDFYTSKIVTINPYDPGVVNNYNNLYGIDTVIVAPNPNNGNFNLQVKLFKNQRVYIKIYTVTGAVLWSKQWEYTNLVQEPVSLPSNVGNGIVFIKVLTDDDARDVQMLITK